MDATWFQPDLELAQCDLEVLQRDLDSRKIAVEVGYSWRSAAQAEPAEGAGGFASELSMKGFVSHVQHTLLPPDEVRRIYIYILRASPLPPAPGF